MLILFGAYFSSSRISRDIIYKRGLIVTFFVNKLHNEVNVVNKLHKEINLISLIWSLKRHLWTTSHRSSIETYRSTPDDPRILSQEGCRRSFTTGLQIHIWYNRLRVWQACGTTIYGCGPQPVVEALIPVIILVIYSSIE